MKPLPRVIKQPAAGPPPEGGAAPTGDPERPAGRPDALAAGEATAAAEQPARVLRGAPAQRAAQAVLAEGGELEADFPVAGGARPQAAPRPPAHRSGEARTLREAWEAEWADRLEAQKAAARAEGFEEGYAEAARSLEAAFEAERSERLSDLARLEDMVQAFFEESEAELVHLAFEVAQAVLEAPLPPEVRTLSERALSEAVEQLAGSALVRIQLHPVDLLRLQEAGLVEQLEALHSSLRWDPNPQMKQGEWSVASPTAVIRRLESELIHTLQERLSHLAARREERGSEDAAQEADD